MHGRIKVKTTAQQDAEKRAERTKKVAQYRAAMKEFLRRRGEGLRGADLLPLIAGVLLANPDLTVLWNMRKEMIRELMDRESVEEETEEEEEGEKKVTMRKMT